MRIFPVVILKVSNKRSLIARGSLYKLNRNKEALQKIAEKMEKGQDQSR